ncbi:hypothetical protein AKJ16_DCAP13285 [Drosera capensis]
MITLSNCCELLKEKLVEGLRGIQRTEKLKIRNCSSTFSAQCIKAATTYMQKYCFFFWFHQVQISREKYFKLDLVSISLKLVIKL